MAAGGSWEGLDLFEDDTAHEPLKYGDYIYLTALKQDSPNFDGFLWERPTAISAGYLLGQAFHLGLWLRTARCHVCCPLPADHGAAWTVRARGHIG